MSKVLINLSGHQLAEQTKNALEKEFEIIEEIFIPYLEFDDNISNQIISLLEDVTIKLDGSKTVTLIMPGHSVLAALVFNFIFGLIGHPPDVYMLQVNENGIYMPFKCFSGLQIKKSGRLYRETFIKQD